MKIYLETGFVVDLTESDYDFEVSASVITDLILIKGVAIDYHTRVEFNSPCVIPRSIHRLMLQPEDNLEPKLFVVPTKRGPLASPGLQGAMSKTSIGMKPSYISEGGLLCEKHSSMLRLQRKQSSMMRVTKSQVDGHTVQSFTAIPPIKNAGQLPPIEQTTLPHDDKDVKIPIPGVDV